MGVPARQVPGGELPLGGTKVMALQDLGSVLWHFVSQESTIHKAASVPLIALAS